MKLSPVVNNTKAAAHPILKGLTYSMSIAIISSFIVAILLYFTSLSDAKLPVISYVITAVSLLVGGFVTGKKAETRGWYFGGITGLVYGVVLVIISFLAFNMNLNLKSIVLIILTFLFGAFGGIFGVNSKK